MPTAIDRELRQGCGSDRRQRRWGLRHHGVLAGLIVWIMPTVAMSQDPVIEKSDAKGGSIVLRIGEEEHDTPSLIFAGATTETTAPASILRFVNTDQHSGPAHVTLIDAASGSVLAAWTSPALPPFGSLEISLTQLINTAAPRLPKHPAPQILDLKIRAEFSGTIQHVGDSDGSIVNLTACGDMIRSVGRVFGNIAWPGRRAAADFVRIVNAGSRPGQVTFALREGSTGTRLATWKSPEIPALGSIAVSVTEITADASPPLDRPIATLTMSGEFVAPEMRFEPLSQSKNGNGFANLSAVCRLPSDSDAQITDSISR